MLQYDPRLHAAAGGSSARPLADAALPVDSYNRQLFDVCGAFSVEPSPHSSGVVHGAVSQGRVGRFDTAFVSLDARRILRDARMIRQDPGEHLFLLVQEEGDCKILQGDSRTRLATGDMFIVDSTHPSDFVFSGVRSRQISLHLPRDEAVRRLGEACTTGVGIDRKDPLFQALRLVIGRMVQGGEAAEAPLSEALFNLLGAYFSAREKPTDRRDDTMYEAALRAIATRAADPRFGLDELAGDLGVSRRTLQRLFGRNGDTVSGRLLAARLEVAWSRLQSLPADNRRASIAMLAFDCGFNDLSYFYRVFRARFGLAPGDLLRRA